jgi:molybdopterin converting factor subunit 1
MGVRIHVRLFAMQREIAGTRQLDLDLRDGATIEDAWRALVERFPRLAPGRASVRFAHNGGYAPSGTVLADGDEVAMIPPVSGGAADEGAATDRVRILEIRESLLDANVVAELSSRLATPDDGAIVGFLGVTRRSPGTPAPGQEDEAARHAGSSVESLEYEALPEMALRVMGAIADEIEARFGVTRLAIVHRTGNVPLGAASVAIVACAPHRDAAFEAARYAIDETKGRAPIWKAEQFGDGRVWIGEPARDSPKTEATPREPSVRGLGEPARDGPAEG